MNGFYTEEGKNGLSLRSGGRGICKEGTMPTVRDLHVADGSKKGGHRATDQTAGAYNEKRLADKE